MEILKRFRLLTELYSFLLLNSRNIQRKQKHPLKFPSPYGVIFILTISYYFDEELNMFVFPSPYGVIFILTMKYLFIETWTKGFPSPYGVIFILT